MVRFVIFLTAFLLLLAPQMLFSQGTADSLRTVIGKTQGQRKAALMLELANHFLADHPDSTIYHAKRAQAIARKTNDHVSVIRGYSMIGEAHQKQNQLKEAISAYLKGLSLAEKHDEKSLAGTIYNGIGVCYFAMSNIDKAEQYMKLAAQAKKEANDYRYYALISANIAATQIMNQSFDEAILTLRDAERTLLKNKQQEYLSTVYNSLGAAYQTVQPDSSIHYYRKSFEASSKNNDYLNMMTSCQNIGDYYFDRKNYPQAIEYMKKAIAINDKRPEDHYKPALFGRISELYETMQDYKTAYQYKKLETESRQRLFEAEKQKEVEELEIKYQTEKKEKEIQLNNREIEQSKNRQNIILFSAISLFLVAGFITYLLFQRRRITQEFEQEKLRMFENIFHEIRTPLTLIDGPIQLMKQRSDSVHQQEQLSLMERNSKKLIHLVNELLDASKLGKGSYQLHYTSGNIDEFMHHIIESFSVEAASKNIRIDSTQQHAAKYYAFPSNALEKILSNLIGNAVKYCPPGSEIRVASKTEGNQLIIEVSDNGPGIPKKDQQKVFRRFFRGKHAADVTGTGIGLSLVKELVALSQGTIALQSSTAGTTFTISIPLRELDTSVSTPAENEGIPVLLLAEDDADTAAFSISVLQENFKVIHVQNGQLAIDAIRENLPDIVLSDVMMPVKDGIGLLQEIRADELTNHLPFVLFSAKASLESRLEGLQHGADAYISKPFSPEELLLTIQNLFNTVQRNRDAYTDSMQSEKTFDERIQSPNAYINKVTAHIVGNIDNPEYSVNELSADMAVSRSQLHRKLVALTGFSTTNFIRMIRLEKAKDLLSGNAGNITEIAYQCGFSSQSYFTRSFTEHFGKSPSQFIKNQ